MNPQNLNKTDEAAYGWYEDRYQSILVSRNRWLVTGLLALGLAAIQGLTLFRFAPLKTTVPYLVKEETSGAITTVTPLTGDSSITYSEAMRKYFIGKYLTSRETYDPIDLLENYRTVELMTGGSEGHVFHESIVSNNPASPIALYGSQAKRYIRIKSISFLNDAAAQIRFTALERRGSNPDKLSDWIATIGFGFGNVSTDESVRLVNPMGFLVTSYRIDQEVVP